MARRRVTIEHDPPRLLKAAPHGVDYKEIRDSFDEEGVPEDLHDAATIAEAGEESGYTSQQSSALAGEPEAVSREEQDRQTRASRARREEVVMAPLWEIDRRLERCEESGNYKQGKVRFVRKLLNQLGEDAMRSAVE